MVDGRALILLWGLLAVACQQGPPPVDPELHLTRALCTRAEEALAAGDLDEATRRAREALDRDPAPAQRGRALAVLGRIAGDPWLLAQALGDLEPLGPGPALADVRQHLAEQSLAAGEPAVALEQLLHLRDELAGPVIRQASEPVGLTLRQASTEHLVASARRQLGDAAGALEHQRQAALLLTRVPAELAQPLRVDVRLALGDDWLRAGEPQQAFQWLARSAALAQPLGLHEQRLRALVGLADALQAMGRPADALAEAGRARALAESLGDTETVASLERRQERWASAPR